MTERTEKGKLIIRQAIADRNTELLRACIRQFKALKQENIMYKELENCPLSLLKKAGLLIRIKRKSTGDEIVIGKDISYDALIEIIKRGVAREVMEKILDINSLFGGTITEIRKEKYEI